MITEHTAKSVPEPQRFRAFQVNKTDAVSAGFVTLGVEDLSPGEVVIRTAHAGLNYKDALAAQGRVISRYPRVAGSDFSGVVLHSDDARFAPGDAVLACADGLGVERDGGFSELVRVPADSLLHLPAGLSLLDAAALGVAGFTAALAVHLLEEAGLRSGQGPVLVTGASGGVGTMALDMLAMRGHEVCAMSGKSQQRENLLRLGASQWLDGRQPPALNRPLESGQWAGAVDTVGGDYLPWIIASTRERGVIASLGNAAGNSFSSSVLPFILRSIKLIGVNVTAYRSLEQTLWTRLATDLRPARALKMVQQIDFAQVPEYLERLRKREVTGRVVARLN